MTSAPSLVLDQLAAQPRVPATARIAPGPQQLAGTATAQPSKNYTARRLLAAALARGAGTVHNVATSDDAHAMMRGVRAMGAHLEFSPPTQPGSGGTVAVQGIGGRPRLEDPAQPIDVGNAGAVLRLLLGVGALLPQVTFTTSHPESLGRRPNADLLQALEQIGCTTHSQPPDGRLPITVKGGRLHGGSIQVSGARSSQFLSSLLFLSPLVGEPVEIRVVDDLVSKPAVRQTLEILADAGIAVEASADLMNFRIKPQEYGAGETSVNGDWPGSAAILAAAAVTDSHIELLGLSDDNQGERLCARVLQAMGCRIGFFPARENRPAGVRVEGSPGGLRGYEFDGDPMTDAVLALMGAASLAQGRTRIHNVANLRIKECDRISEPLAELRKLGVRCWEGHQVGDSDPDAILIEGNPGGYEGGIEVDGRGDHRVIMMLSIVGLRCRKGLTITGAHHVAKSYPAFFQHLALLGAQVNLIRD